jgi:hypothetical protein
MAYGSGNDKKVDIQSVEEIKEFLPGKWSAFVSYSGTNITYRFLITENQIKIWKQPFHYGLGEPAEAWKENPDEIIDYSIGPLQTESHGNKYRLLGKCEYGDIMIWSFKGNEGDLQVGKIEYNYFDTRLNLERGWKEN